MMSATSFYKNAAHNEQNSSLPLDIDINDDDVPDLALTTAESDLALAAQTNRHSTDLVRLYLQEIGRVRLLGRDEEVAEAQKVQRYLRMRLLLSAAATEGDTVIIPYSRLVEVQERLTAELGHRPSLERWAATAGINLPDLKPTLANGKRRWAEIVNLTVEELDQVQTQGLQAKSHMIKANLRLVVSVAKKYQNRGLELLDLIQEGTLGLERAVEKFDPTKGYRFSTYAYWWIRQGITRSIATSSRTIRLPVHITEKLNLALELDMTAIQVREVLLRVPRSVSLETKVGKDKDTELGELLETDTITPEEMLMRESLHKDLHHLLDDLTSRERDVILMRFGLSDGHAYSLAEIGRALDLSRERVRQIESKALQKLRQPKRRNLVRDYLESLS